MLSVMKHLETSSWLLTLLGLYASWIFHCSNKYGGGFFHCPQQFFSFPTLKCNLLLILIELCSYLHVSLWQNHWNNFNIFFTLILLFLERPLSHLPCHSTFGVYYCFTSQSGWKLLLSKAALFPFLISWVYFWIIQILFLRKFSGHFRRNLLKVFFTGVHDNLCPSVTPLWVLKLIALNGAKRHLQSIYLCVLCLCSSSFLPRQLRNWAKLHDTVRCYVGPTKKGWCLLYGGGSIALEIWNVSVGEHWVTAEINPMLQILHLVLIHGEGGQRLLQQLC